VESRVRQKLEADLSFAAKSIKPPNAHSLQVADSIRSQQSGLALSRTLSWERGSTEVGCTLGVIVRRLESKG
jgi:hypothetical protein